MSLQFDWTTFNAMLVASAGPLIVVAGGCFTAWRITGRITQRVEEMKAQFQADLERERMTLQREMERERREGGSRAAVFAERVKVAREISGTAGTMYRWCANYTDEWQLNPHIPAEAQVPKELDASLLTAVMGNAWLLTPGVRQAAEEYRKAFRRYYVFATEHSTPGMDLDELRFLHDDLGGEISNMMLDGNMGSLDGTF